MKIIQWRRELLLPLVLLHISVMLWLYVHDLLHQLSVRKRLQVQEERKEMVKSSCGEEELSQIKSSDLEHFIVDDDHGLIYCYVPKVACIHGKGFMLSLKHGEPYPDPTSKSLGNVHDMSRFKTLNKFSKTEIKAKLKHYTKFLFVRNPFTRLISAFRNKLEKPKDIMYAKYGRYILQHYTNHSSLPKTGKEAIASGKLMSFNNFVHFLIDPKTKQPFDPHWRPIPRLCHPCQIQYDFIGFHETLDEDFELLLSTLHLTKEMTFLSAYNNMTSSDSVLEWFSRVNLKDRRKLFALYEEDFKLFGYRRPDELLEDVDEVTTAPLNPDV